MYHNIFDDRDSTFLLILILHYFFHRSESSQSVYVISESIFNLKKLLKRLLPHNHMNFDDFDCFWIQKKMKNKLNFYYIHIYFF